LSIGALSGIEPDLLAHAFSIARAGTLAEEAVLEIDHLPARVRCRRCGAESETEPNALICPACGNWQVEVIGGEEMLLSSLELLSAQA
jgi:hydrogenase nickel incorporation protein HypA/HybF